MKNFQEKDIIEPCNDTCSFCFLNYTDILEKNYLFRNITLSEIGRLIRDVHHQVKQFDKGEIIAYSGDEYHSLLILVKGSVIGEIVDFEGHVLRIEELKAPDTLATAFIFGDNNRLPVNVTALEETRLLVIQRQELLQLFKKNDTVLRNYLDIISNRTQYLSKRIKLLTLNSIKGKIAHYLLDQVKKTDELNVVLKNTQNELADMFGVARPSVARALKEMNAAGIITSKGKNITVLDKSALSGLLR